MESFPFQIEKLELRGDTMIKLHPGNILMPANYEDLLPHIYNMEIRKDDIWLLGGWKSGNLWLSELIWLVHHDGDVDLAKSASHHERWCFPELSEHDDFIASKRGVPSPEPERHRFQETVNHPSPRFIRTHFNLSILPPSLLDTAKVFYIARNPKDVLASAYYFVSGLLDISIEFTELCESYLEKDNWMRQTIFHVKEAWKRRDHPNLHIIFYEDMKKDLVGVIKRVAQALNKTLNQQQIDVIERHLGFEEMRKNPMINMDELKTKGLLNKETNYLRKGITGDWKNVFTPSFLKGWDEWYKELDCADIPFPET